MPGRDIIVIGASAGGIDPLRQLVQGLPANLPAAVFVVVHISPHGPSFLPKILSRAGLLPAIHPGDGQAIRPGTIYVAPPDWHLMVKPDQVRLARGAHENNHRPAIDVLFRTAAHSYGNRVIGVVLSGVLDDGTAGLAAVKSAGGVAVVQDPGDALYPDMPQNALNQVRVDYSLPGADLPALLVRLTADASPRALSGTATLPESDATEDGVTELEAKAVHRHDRPGVPSGFACPQCGGALWELHDDELLRFRCRTGHAWSIETLMAEQSDQLEGALWTALRALEEQAALAHRLAERATKRDQPILAEKFESRAESATAQAEVIRKVLRTRRPDSPTDPFRPTPPPDNEPTAQ